MFSIIAQLSAGILLLGALSSFLGIRHGTRLQARTATTSRGRRLRQSSFWESSSALFFIGMVIALFFSLGAAIVLAIPMMFTYGVYVQLTPISHHLGSEGLRVGEYMRIG